MWNWTSWKSEFRPFSLNRIQSSDYQNESQILSTASAIGGNITLAICQPREVLNCLVSRLQIRDRPFAGRNLPPRLSFLRCSLVSYSCTCFPPSYFFSAQENTQRTNAEKQSKPKSKLVSRTLPLSLDGGQGEGGGGQNARTPKQNNVRRKIPKPKLSGAYKNQINDLRLNSVI